MTCLRPPFFREKGTIKKRSQPADQLTVVYVPTVVGAFLCGTVNPDDTAVLALIARSNLVDRMAGRSARETGAPASARRLYFTFSPRL